MYFLHFLPIILSEFCAVENDRYTSSLQPPSCKGILHFIVGCVYTVQENTVCRNVLKLSELHRSRLNGWVVGAFHWEIHKMWHDMKENI